jgi:hypothetical protein
VKRLLLAATAVVAVGGLGACTSQPSAKAVAKDMVQSITVPGGQRLPQPQQDCMLSVIDKMSSEEISQLGAENLNATITSSGGGNAAMQAFIKKLQSCETAQSTAGTEPTGTAPTATAAAG